MVIFLSTVSFGMFVSYIQYGRLQFIELSTGHSYECSTQRWVTECYTQQ